MFIGGKSVLKARASESWPTAAGKIVSSTVETGKSQKKKKTTYYAKVVYEFVAGGRMWSSDDVSFGEYRSSDPAHARSVVEKYPAGAAVTVHYSPEDPASSVLEAGLSGGVFFLPGLGAFFLLAGIAMLFWLPRAAARQQNPRGGG